MAIKKFLMENGKQVWPITRADCVYTVAGDDLLSNVVDKIAQDLLAEANRAKGEEQRIEGKVNKEIEDRQAAVKEVADNLAQEIQDRIDAVQDVQDQLDALAGEGEGSVAEQIENMQQELQGNIDAVEDKFDEFKADQEEKNGALDQKDADLEKAIEDEEAARLAKEENFEGRIAANEAFVAAHDHKPMEDRIAALEDLHKEGGAVEEAIQAVQNALDEFEEAQGIKDGQQDQAIQAAQNAAQQAQKEVDDLEVLIGNASSTDAEGQPVPATGMMQKIEANDAAIKAEKARAEGQEAAIRQEMADAMAQEVADRNAAIKVEADRAVAEEAKIRGEFAAADAALKQELQAEIDADVKVEKERAEAKEAELLAAINKEVEDRGAAVLAEENARKAADEALDGRVKALENDKPVQDAAIQAAQAAAEQAQAEVDALEGVVGAKAEEGKSATGVFKYVDDRESAIMNQVGEAVDGIAGLVTAEENRAKGEEQRIVGLINALQQDVDQNEADCDAALAGEKSRAEAAEKALADRLVVIEGEGDGSIKKAVADEAQARQNADNELDGRLQAVEAMVGLEGGEEGDSLADRVAANEAKLAGLEKDTVQAAIDQAEADAKAHAEQKIAELVDSAPEAMNTLNELAKAINDNQDVYDAYVEEHAQAMAQQKLDLQNEIDADVKAEADRAKGEEARIEAKLDKTKTDLQAEIDADVKEEADRAKAAEAALEAKIAAIFKAYDGDKEYDDLAPLQ